MLKGKTVGLDLEVMRPLLEGLLKNMEGGVFTIDRRSLFLTQLFGLPISMGKQGV